MGNSVIKLNVSPYNAFAFYGENKTPSPIINIGLLRQPIIFHEQARGGLKEEEKLFLMPKGWQYFHNLLSGKTGDLLVILSNEEIVGMAALVQAKTFATAISDGNITYPDKSGFLKNKYGESSIAIIQSLCVLDKSKGYANALINAAVLLAMERGNNYVLAQISEKNKGSKKRFKEEGFKKKVDWSSKLDGVTRELLSNNLSAHRPITKPPEHKVVTLHY